MLIVVMGIQKEHNVTRATESRVSFSEVTAKYLSVSCIAVSTEMSHVDVRSRSTLIIIRGVSLQCWKSASIAKQMFGESRGHGSRCCCCNKSIEYHVQNVVFCKGWNIFNSWHWALMGSESVLSSQHCGKSATFLLKVTRKLEQGRFFLDRNIWGIRQQVSPKTTWLVLKQYSSLGCFTLCVCSILYCLNKVLKNQVVGGFKVVFRGPQPKCVTPSWDMILIQLNFSL